MGLKKNNMTILSGSMKKHWIMYVTDMKLLINPVDRNANNMTHYLNKMMLSMNSKFI